ncbi:MAG: deoxynucleoside kinase [Egibacteraceae bacterium]
MTASRPAPAGNLRTLAVAVEGTCFAGKTTLATALARRLRVVMIPEYAELAPLPPFPPRDHDDVRAALAYLRNLEIRRSAQVRRARTPVVILDRSPLSCIAFQYGMRRLGVPCDHRLAVEVFTDASTQRLITPPEQYVYLHIDQTVALDRQRDRGPVVACLMDPAAVEDMNRAYRHFLSRLAPDRRLILDGSRPLASLFAETSTFIATSRTDNGSPANDWRCLLDLPTQVRASSAPGGPR